MNVLYRVVRPIVTLSLVAAMMSKALAATVDVPGVYIPDAVGVEVLVGMSYKHGCADLVSRALVASGFVIRERSRTDLVATLGLAVADVRCLGDIVVVDVAGRSKRMIGFITDRLTLTADDDGVVPRRIPAYVVPPMAGGPSASVSSVRFIHEDVSRCEKAARRALSAGGFSVKVGDGPDLLFGDDGVRFASVYCQTAAPRAYVVLNVAGFAKPDVDAALAALQRRFLAANDR